MLSARRSCSALTLLALVAGACAAPPAGAERSAPPTPAAVAATPAMKPGPPGTITGTLTYPGGPGTEIVVYAIPFEPIEPLSVRAAWGSGPRPSASFAFTGVPDGDYILVAYLAGDRVGRQQGSFTEAAFCGLGPGCDDHTPIVITVTPRFGIAGVVISDWNAPPGGFARRPDGP